MFTRSVLSFLHSPMSSSYAMRARARAVPGLRLYRTAALAASSTSNIAAPRYNSTASVGSPTLSPRREMSSMQKQQASGSVMIGETPLVELKMINPNPNVKIMLKCEYMNPSGSIKDRIAQYILDKATEEGKIGPGSTVVASSSGNTAAAIAMQAAVRGMKAVIITNTKCSKEKQDVLWGYGAELIVTPSGVPADDPEHYQNVEDRLVREKGWYGVDQYNNPNNPEAYYKTLGPEIWQGTEGEVTHLFAAASTGGTISGIGRYLKDQNSKVKVVCPDPVGSIFEPYFREGVMKEVGSFQVEGVGKDSIPGAMDFSIIDEMPRVEDKEAFAMCRRLAQEEGLLVGGSAGLNVHAAVEYAKTLTEPATIVVIAPDSGLKYISKVYNEDWLSSKGFVDAPTSSDTTPVAATEASGVPTGGWDLIEKGVVPLVGKYLTESDDIDKPSVVLQDATQLAASFEKSGVPLHLDDDAKPFGNDELTKACEAVLDNSVRTASPLFNNQLYAAADKFGLAGEWLASALNTNAHTYEVAPVFTLMEKALISKLARVVGGAYRDAESSGKVEGLFVPGGSIANTYALHLARHRMFPESKTEGNSAAPGRLMLFVSEECHYSFKKAANLMGLGTNSVVGVPTLPLSVTSKETHVHAGGMDPEALDTAIAKAKAEGHVPFFVGATAGTTVLGAFDPLEPIADVCDKHGVWMHVDGAWGGANVFSKARKATVAGMDRANSLVWNAHKLMGAPLQASMFVTKEHGLLRACNSAAAEYLFQKDKNNADLDAGDLTIQCGRRTDMLSVWMMWKALGDAGFEQRVEHSIGLLNHLSDQAQSFVDTDGQPVFRQVGELGERINYLFYYTPKHLRHLKLDEMNEDQLAELAAVTPKIKDAMQRTGRALIGYQSALGLKNAWRVVFPGAKENLSPEGVEIILSDIARLGDEVSKP